MCKKVAWNWNDKMNSSAHVQHIHTPPPHRRMDSGVLTSRYDRADSGVTNMRQSSSFDELGGVGESSDDEADHSVIRMVLSTGNLDRASDDNVCSSGDNITTTCRIMPNTTSSCNGNGNSTRRRRHKRLNSRSNTIANTADGGRPSPIAEHNSLEYSKQQQDQQQQHCYDKVSLSADITAETTTMISMTETLLTTPDNISNNTNRVSTPTTDETHTIVENHSNAQLPQSIVTKTRTFPSLSENTSTATATTTPTSSQKNHQHISVEHIMTTPKFKNTSPLSLWQPGQSLWGSDNDECIKQHQHRHQYQHLNQMNKPTIPSTFAPSPSNEPPKRLPKPKPNPRPLLRAKPAAIQRHATAPAVPSPTKHKTNVLDDALMDRAFIIRQNLMNFELQELASEAEKAAESGKEKFAGSASKFGIQESPQYKPKMVNEYNDGIVIVIPTLSQGNVDRYQYQHYQQLNNPGYRTPIRQRKTFVDIDYSPYTPSYFSRKKQIPVTSLRNFGEIIPNFNDMHTNIRLHFSREGVYIAKLPELHRNRSLIKNDTDDTIEKENDDDDDDDNGGDGDASVAPSHTGSISSFSSYAVASLRSIIDDYVTKQQRPKSPPLGDRQTTLRTCSSMSNATSTNLPPKDNIDQMLKKNKSADYGERMRTKLPPIQLSATQFKPAIGVSPSNDSDSDDSSVEYYGRKSSNSVSSNFSDLKPHNLSASMDFSEQSVGELRKIPSNKSGGGSSVDIHQPILQRRRRDRNNNGGRGTSHSVSFETEKANYRALLVRMNHNNNTLHTTIENDSFDVDVDQSSCAPSLTHQLEIIPPTSSTTSPTNEGNNANTPTKSTTPMASFLNKIQNQFSRTNSQGASSPKAAEDESNKQFVSNFFYTSQISDTSQSITDSSSAGGGALLETNTLLKKLEINPKRHRKDPFHLPGCGPNEFLSSCASAGKVSDLVLDWFNVKRGPTKPKNSITIIDPEQSLNPNWIKRTWQAGDESPSDDNGKQHPRRQRIFTPPKLSVRHNTVEESDAISLCSPVTEHDEEESGVVCPEIQQPLCPEI